MTEQLCPTCGCAFSGEGYAEEGVLYCCAPCATGSSCECGCCSIVEEFEGDKPIIPPTG